MQKTAATSPKLSQGLPFAPTTERVPELARVDAARRFAARTTHTPPHRPASAKHRQQHRQRLPHAALPSVPNPATNPGVSSKQYALDASKPLPVPVRRNTPEERGGWVSCHASCQLPPGGSLLVLCSASVGTRGLRVGQVGWCLFAGASPRSLPRGLGKESERCPLLLGAALMRVATRILARPFGCR